MAIYGIDMLYKEMAYEAVGVSGEAAVLAISKAYVEFARNHPGLYEATLLAPDMEDEDVQQAGAKIVELSVRVLQAFDLQGERALHAVRGFRSILHGFSSLEQSGGFKIALDLDESLETIIKAFIKGMRELVLVGTFHLASSFIRCRWYNVINIYDQRNEIYAET